MIHLLFPKNYFWYTEVLDVVNRYVVCNINGTEWSQKVIYLKWCDLNFSSCQNSDYNFLNMPTLKCHCVPQLQIKWFFLDNLVCAHTWPVCVPCAGKIIFNYVKNILLCAEFNTYICTGWSLLTEANVLIHKLNIVHYFMALCILNLKNNAAPVSQLTDQNIAYPFMFYT